MEPEPPGAAFFLPEAGAEPILSEPEEIQIHINLKKKKNIQPFFSNIKKTFVFQLTLLALNKGTFPSKPTFFFFFRFSSYKIFFNISDRAKIKP